MSMLRVNNENDVPQGLRAGNASRKSFKALNEQPSKAEKRPRAVKTHSSSVSGRRAVLGDVTNRVNQTKKPTTNTVSLPMKKPMKRTKITHERVAMTPMATTLGTLGITDKSSPVSLVASVKAKKENHDIDSCDKHDPTSCWPYAEDINQYHLDTEKLRKPSASYMSRQTDINSKMRAILVDWLVDVHCKYDLLPQTLHVAVHLIDRYLEKDLSVPRQRLQLVGVTAMFIASKYEEIYPPEAEDFVRITDNAYTRDEVFKMEDKLLASIDYRVTFPTSYQFMKRFIKAARTCDDRVEHFAHYIIDRSLQEYKMVKYLPSTIAASAVHIARTQMNDLPVWNSTLEYHSSYSEGALADCVNDLKEILWNVQNGIGKTSKLSAVRRKFDKERFMGVASHPLVFDRAPLC